MTVLTDDFTFDRTGTTEARLEAVEQVVEALVRAHALMTKHVHESNGEGGITSRPRLRSRKRNSVHDDVVVPL